METSPRESAFGSLQAEIGPDSGVTVAVGVGVEVGVEVGDVVGVGVGDGAAGVIDLATANN
jgi:hypothetical protein